MAEFSNTLIKMSDNQLHALLDFMFMQEEKAQSIIEAFRTASLELNHPKLVENILEEIDPNSFKSDSTDLKSIIDTLIAVYQANQNSEVSNEVFVDAICDSLKNSGESDVSDEKALLLKRRLLIFLENPNSIEHSLQAVSIARDHQNIFLNVAIHSDIRSIFISSKSESNQDLVGFSMSHMLKILYRDIDGEKECFVSLDLDDLYVLALEIGNAIEREEKLEEYFRESGVSLMKAGTFYDS